MLSVVVNIDERFLCMCTKLNIRIGLKRWVVVGMLCTVHTVFSLHLDPHEQLLR